LKISASIIVKDENTPIFYQCIKGLDPFVDEIVIYDTGSTDGTQDAAKMASPKVRVVESKDKKLFDKNGNFNFGRAKTLAGKKCRGDWVIIVDADEVFTTTAAPAQMRGFLGSLPGDVGGLNVKMMNYNADGTAQGESWVTTKIARHGYYYKRPIHEIIVLKPGSKKQAALTDVLIRHYGYDKKTWEDKGKAQRNIEALQAEYERLKNSDDYAGLSLTCFYLMNQHILNGDYEAGIAAGLECLDVAEKNNYVNGLYEGVYHSVFAAKFFHMNDPKGALELLKKGVDRYPKNIDLNFDGAMVCRMRGDRTNLNKYGQKYFELVDEYEKNPATIGNRFVLAGTDKKKSEVNQWLRTKKTMFTGHCFSLDGIAQQLQDIGLHFGNEKNGMDGVASWIHVAPGGTVSWIPGGVVDAGNFDAVCHIVMHPLVAIHRALGDSEEAYLYRFERIGHPGGDHGLRWAMHSWLRWNEYIESFNLLGTYQYEKLSIEMPGILHKIGYETNAVFKFPKPDPLKAPITWGALRQVDAELAEKIEQKGREYGYDI
jgi:glycosyltransferase involved in cell wall biosynthesis